eukprot:c25143_g2_i3 orf=186-989(-)
MGLSQNILAIANFVGFLLAIPLVGAGIWLITEHNTQCVKFLEWPVILLGIILLFVSLAGFIGAVWRVTSLLSVYLFGMVIIIILLMSLTIFGLVVTNDGPSQQVGYRTYSLSSYSDWLRNRVQDSGNWKRIKSCIRDSGTCDKLRENYYYSTASNFYSMEFSAIQSGCCMPPASCGYRYVNPTYWINPSNAVANADCGSWSNVQTELCYDCETCKAGLLAGVKGDWRKASVLTLAVLIGLIVLYIIACCAVQSARTEELFKHYRRGY